MQERIIVGAKAAENSINANIIAKTLDYLTAYACKLALIINFGRTSLEYRRFIF